MPILTTVLTIQGLGEDSQRLVIVDDHGLLLHSFKHPLKGQMI